VKPSGDYEKDSRVGREHALQFMAYENERQRTDPEAAPIIGSIVKDIIASGDRGGIAKGFFTTIVECSRFNWQPGEIARFRGHYEQIDREFDEAMAAVRRKKRPPVPGDSSVRRARDLAERLVWRVGQGPQSGLHGRFALSLARFGQRLSR
jgi:hypothetical protein